MYVQSLAASECQACVGRSLKVIVETVSLWLGAFQGVQGSTCVPGGRRGTGVCVAGLGLSGKWCPHQRKRRKQLEEEEPKRGRGRRPAPALFWEQEGEPRQPGDAAGAPQPLVPACPPAWATRLVRTGLESAREAPSFVLPRQALGLASQGRWRLRGGFQAPPLTTGSGGWERDAGRRACRKAEGCSYVPERPLPSKAGRPAAGRDECSEMEQQPPGLAHSGFPLPGSGQRVPWSRWRSPSTTTHWAWGALTWPLGMPAAASD